ncbi:MAG TPA: helix-hairpin-helix domain-containing protein [Ktedonobacteraceae bacterium]|nr:helix-hairpin-helix domain-containing protein [Ktedonobacteraceae bacterium]
MSIMQLTQTIQIVPPSQRSLKKNYTKNVRPSQPTLPGLEEVKPDVEAAQQAVTNQQIADVLNNIANLLDSQRGNPYRIQAYRNAAQGVLELEEPAATFIARHEHLPVPGLGRRLHTRIKELVETGTMTFYNDLFMQSLPPAARSLMAVEFVGPHTAARLYEDLNIDSPEKLWRAARQQRIQQLPGFGVRSEARLKDAAARLLQQEKQPPLHGAA